MRFDRLLIDGYSLLYRHPELSRLMRAGRIRLARQKLIELLERMAGTLADEISVVFDGATGTEGPVLDSPVVGVAFSPPDQTADTVIERRVHADPRPASLCVVTSDRLERETVTASGARTMSCGEFLEVMVDFQRDLPRRLGAASPRRWRTNLGALFPPDADK